MFDLTGKTAVVIGAASGIGEAIAAGFTRQGARVLALDIKPDASRQIAALDITDGPAVDRVLAEIDRRHGIDVLVCMPAVNVRKPILQYTDEEVSLVLDVNMKGNFRVLRAAGRAMTARKKGSIILFSSIRSQSVEPGQSVYAATKAGIVQLARTAAAEFGPCGVRVNAIAPGVI
jgi:NAD(P)-dependent dehydrogenase (short-subunit alcohol dehydrogenase family)